MSQHTSLADIWRWLKRVGGKYSASQLIHPNPEQEAERLANMFAARHHHKIYLPTLKCPLSD